jgi:hypothetical protein
MAVFSWPCGVDRADGLSDGWGTQRSDLVRDRNRAGRRVESDDTLIQLVSPDGRRVVVIRTAQGNQDLWLLMAHGPAPTFDPAPEYLPVRSQTAHGSSICRAAKG